MSGDRLNYDELCPTCLEAGAKQNLFLEMDTCAIRCELGHTFECLPSDQVLQTGQEKPAAEEKSEPVTVVDSPQLGDVIDAEFEEVSEVKPPAEETETVNTLENRRLAEIAAQIAPGAGVKISEIGNYVAEGMATRLPDGDVLLGVRIPEVWVSAVQSEAEAQMKSPAAYFSDWLTSPEMRSAIIDWLENYWVSSYTQSR